MAAFNGAVLLLVVLGAALWVGRQIKESPMVRPVGCFCEVIYPHHGACLTCTCPDCGAYGRYGAPIKHKVTCAP